MTEETVGKGFQPVCIVDGPTDDYECRREQFPEALRRGEADLYVSKSWIRVECLTSRLDSTGLKHLAPIATK